MFIEFMHVLIIFISGLAENIEIEQYIILYGRFPSDYITINYYRIEPDLVAFDCLQ